MKNSSIAQIPGYCCITVDLEIGILDGNGEIDRFLAALH